MDELYAPFVSTADAAARPGPTALDGDGSKRAANCAVSSQNISQKTGCYLRCVEITVSGASLEHAR